MWFADVPWNKASSYWGIPMTVETPLDVNNSWLLMYLSVVAASFQKVGIQTPSWSRRFLWWLGGRCSRSCRTLSHHRPISNLQGHREIELHEGMRRTAMKHGGFLSHKGVPANHPVVLDDQFTSVCCGNNHGDDDPPWLKNFQRHLQGLPLSKAPVMIRMLERGRSAGLQLLESIHWILRI